MLRRITGVRTVRQVDPKALGWLEGRRAQTRPNFPANRDYADLNDGGERTRSCLVPGRGHTIRLVISVSSWQLRGMGTAWQGTKRRLQAEAPMGAFAADRFPLDQTAEASADENREVTRKSPKPISSLGP
jgi:hypothetical protein